MHLRFGVLFYVLLFTGGIVLNPVTFAVGCIFPDADHPRTLIGKFVPLWYWFKHRGKVHSVQAMILTSLPWLLWDFRAAASFAAGFFIHMMLDACTPSGINWFAKAKSRP